MVEKTVIGGLVIGVIVAGIAALAVSAGPDAASTVRTYGIGPAQAEAASLLERAEKR